VTETGPRPEAEVRAGSVDLAPRPLVITIDGPAGSGKSTTAQEVARRLGLLHLDSGALYRGITLALLRAFDGDLRVDRVDEERIGALDLEVAWASGGPVIWLAGAQVADEDLRSDEVTAHVSAVAAVPAVRSWLLGAQRAGPRFPGLVADGRDMGTVVFPDADVKVYLEADTGVRALRRLQQRGVADPSPDEVMAEARKLEARDAIDAGREVSPLRVPAGALVVDTSDLTFEEQIARILELVEGAG